jgi:endonuclease YncB( thermonuclease family)
MDGVVWRETSPERRRWALHCDAMRPMLTNRIARLVGIGSVLGMAALALSLLLALSAHAETYTARVVSIIDGDTFKEVRDSREIIIRLRWIDAPEKGCDSVTRLPTR